MSAAMEFRQNECGSDAKIKKYIHGLCVNASQLLADGMWNTSNLISDDRYYAAMINVQMSVNPANV